MQYIKELLNLNLKAFGGADLPIGLILLCAAVGMIVATVMIQISSATAYRAIKAMTRHKCTDPESAQTLKKLGLAGDRLVCFAIKRKSPMLLRYISEAAEGEAAEESTAKEESEARFYLTPEMQDRAKELLSRSDITVLHTVLYCVILLALFFGIAALIAIVAPLVL